MNILEMSFDQRTPEWHDARYGRVTGSAARKARSFLKSGASSKERDAYKIQLVAERLTRRAQEIAFVNDAMRHGIEQEPMARVAYEMMTSHVVREVGFIQVVGDGPMIGVSPDGLVGTDGSIEIKCPTTSTHIEWMLSGKCPDEHMDQIQMLLWVTGRSWCDFVSYDPRVPQHLQLFIVRVLRNEEYIEAMSKDIETFLDEVDCLVKKLEKVERIAA
jgi:putative phage-type endonuclease